MEKAYFVRYPKTIYELRRLHLVEQEQSFKIVCTVELGIVDYENFIYGMDADRQFIKDHAILCSDGLVKKCLLIKERRKKNGILVVPVPEHPGFVMWGAYYREDLSS